MSKLKGVVSHHEAEVAELRADRELAVEYLKAAMESLDNPDDRAGGLLALRTVAEAYGGLGAVATEAGISHESLYGHCPRRATRRSRRCWLYSRQWVCGYRSSQSIPPARNQIGPMNGCN